MAKPKLKIELTEVIPKSAFSAGATPKASTNFLRIIKRYIQCRQFLGDTGKFWWQVRRAAFV